MSMDVQAQWERYTASWKTSDAAARSRLFAESLAPACVYTDPTIQARGWDELEAYMDQFHRQVPGGHFVTQSFMEHHGFSIATWNMCTGDGTVIGDGISYGQYDAEGRLVTMTGFFQT